MLCYTCNNKSICKHYQYINDNLEMTIEIKKCNNFNGNLEVEPSSSFKPYFNTSETVLLDTNVEDNVRLDYPDFKDSASDAPNGIYTQAVEVPKVKCTTCEHTDYETGISECDICKKQTCSNCGIIDYNEETNSYITKCTECWSGKEPEKCDPDSVAKISYVSDEESNWDLSMFAETNESTIIPEETKKEKEEDVNKQSNKKSKKQ